MATYTLISSATVGSGGAANMEFTSIPADYTDLLFRFTARYSGSSADIVRLTFNNTSSGWSFRYLEGYGTGVSSGSTFGAGAYMYAGYVNGTANTASTFTSQDIYIPNYLSSNNKSVSIDAVLENNASVGYNNLLAGLWSNTSAITSIKIIPETGTFAQYSTAYLYGISNA
jgi:hypothetical protein